MSCLRCGRKLSNPLSKKRGYGNSCYAKLGADKKKSEELGGKTSDIEKNFVDELKEMVSQ